MKNLLLSIKKRHFTFWGINEERRFGEFKDKRRNIGDKYSTVTNEQVLLESRKEIGSYEEL